MVAIKENTIYLLRIKYSGEDRTRIAISSENIASNVQVGGRLIQLVRTE